MALQSVTSWCQNWRSGAAGRRVLFLKNKSDFWFLTLTFKFSNEITIYSICEPWYFSIFAGAGAERRRRKKSNPRVFFQLFGQKVPRGVGARAGPGHLWCQWWSHGWSPPQMRMLSGSLGAKQPKSDVIWGGGCVPTHQRTKREPRILQHDHGNS